MKPLAIIAALLLLTGCGPMRVGSPQFQHAPELVCIVVIEERPSKISAEVAEAAINACRNAAELEEKKP